MKVRIDSKISDVVNKLSICKENMEYALDLVNEAKVKIESESWKGQSKEATASLVDLCIKFQTELNGFINDNYIAMKNLEDNADDFMQNSTHANTWRK